MAPPFSLVSVRHRSPLDSNPRTCAWAMMLSRRLAANTRPTRPAPMTKPATSFAGRAAVAVAAPRPERVAPRAVARRDAVARPPPRRVANMARGCVHDVGAKEGRTCTRLRQTIRPGIQIWSSRRRDCRRRGVLKFLAPPLAGGTHTPTRSLPQSERPPHASHARILAPPTSSTPPSLETRWPDSAT